ncbi:MAG: 50S ribosomal protein L10 [Candidatus Micrarchaeota archaeon]
MAGESETKGKISRKRRVKEETVASLAERIKGAKVLALADIRNLPDRQFQSVRKKLRGKAEFIVTKNTLISLALKEAKKGGELLAHLTAPTALMLTEMNPFELYANIKKSKGKAAAKPGQVAPYDIIVPEGETNLPPGPVLSELKQGGINAQIKGGKVVVARDSVVARAGEKITDAAAKALQKLGIEPFEVGMNIAAVWENGLVYKKDVLDIDEEKFLAELRGSHAEALNLSVKVAYPTKQSITVLLQKAVMDGKNLAYNAEIYEKDVIGLLLAKANAQAAGLGVTVNIS